MEFNIDIIETIGTFCDARTKLSLALTSREYYTQQLSLFTSKEECYMLCRLQHLVDNALRGYNRLSRISRAHKLMREVMKFPHQIRTHENIRLQFLERLPVWRTEGMGSVKIQEYTKFLESI